VIVPDFIINTILSVDLLQKHVLQLDFSTDSVSGLPQAIHNCSGTALALARSVEKADMKAQSKLCIVIDLAIDIVEDCICTALQFENPIEFPRFILTSLAPLVHHQYKSLFSSEAATAFHYIPKSGAPHIPVHYEDAEHQ